MRAIGVVKDADTGASLPGAHVAVITPVQCVTVPCNEPVVTGTTTDLEGRFQVDVNQGQQVRISYVGYATNFPLLRDGQEVEILMHKDPNVIGEAVVTDSASEGLPFWAKALILLGFTVLIIGGLIYIFKPKS